MSPPPRILIVTAAFGEGHNSAARNLALTLGAKGAETQVSDPCMLAWPALTGLVNHAYRFVTMNFPRIWGRIYRSTDRHDFNDKSNPILDVVEDTLGDLVREYRPTAVVSTYPLYPYYMPRIASAVGREIPVFIVVTDSIEINAAWLRAKCDRWLVTDAFTREEMIRKGIPAEKIVETGFPVNPEFSKITPVAGDCSCDPFRVLFFPVALGSLMEKQARALLDATPRVKLTIVMGRNVRYLFKRARQLRKNYPGRVRLIGWTSRVPWLLNSHHLVVGKAGGATVHEAIAARCPMLIHHLVPGQEEGNLRLLERIGGGKLAEKPEDLARRVADMLADQGAGWRSMKTALSRHGRDAGAIVAANFVLEEIAGRPSEPAN